MTSLDIDVALLIFILHVKINWKKHVYIDPNQYVMLRVMRDEN